MTSIREIGRNAFLLATAVGGPAAVASWLVVANEQPPVVESAPAEPAALVVAQAPVPAALRRGAAATEQVPPRSAPLVTGVLYTSGRAEVVWNGVRFPVENGTYAYLGGETVELAPDALGILRVDGGGTAFLCPGSVSRMRRAEGGGFVQILDSGSARLMMPGGTPFSIEAGERRVSPRDGGSTLTGEGVYAIEVTARAGGDLLAVALRREFDVAAGASGGDRQQVVAGEILSLGADPRAPAATRHSIPPAIFSRLSVGIAGERTGSRPAPDYLCRSEELARYAAQAAAPMVAALEPMVEIVLPEPPAPPEPLPPVDAPLQPTIALAPPGAPSPFDPNVLPPPAAGPGDAADGPTVAAPAAPTSFVGGGAGAAALEVSVSPS